MKTSKGHWEKDCFLYLMTAADLMQLMVSYVTTCSGRAEKEACPIKVGMKRGSGVTGGGRRSRGNAVSIRSAYYLSPC